MCLGFAEDADAGMVLLESLFEIIVEGLVALHRREYYSRSTSMLEVNAGDRQPHHGTEMQFKLREVGGVSECHHTGVVRTRREFAEDHLTLLGEEELHAPDTSTGERLCHCSRHLLRLCQCLVTNLVWLPRLTIVASLLHMSDRWAEESVTVFLCDSEKCELRVEVDKLLDDHLLNVATTTLHCIAERSFEFAVIMHIALSMTRRRHERFYDARKTYLVGSLFEFIVCLGIEILGSAKSEHSRCKVTYGASVHGEVHRPCTWHHLYSLILIFEEFLHTDSLNLGHDDIRAMLLHCRIQGITVEH